MNEHQQPTSRGMHGSGAVAFSTRGEYGVRFMGALARMDHGEPVSLTDIAEQEDLPRAYLEQIIGGLRDAGIIDSQRGAHGGYRLARPANEVRMGAVLRALEGPIVPMACVAEEGSPCNRTGSCTVTHLWTRVRDSVTEALDSFTLAELAQPGAPIGLSRSAKH
ncbi:MAG: RrF2 family transcriptional regulator [Candidatus Limnocylindrus sp.]